MTCASQTFSHNKWMCLSLSMWDHVDPTQVNATNRLSMHSTKLKVQSPDSPLCQHVLRVAGWGKAKGVVAVYLKSKQLLPFGFALAGAGWGTTCDWCGHAQPTTSDITQPFVNPLKSKFLLESTHVFITSLMCRLHFLCQFPVIVFVKFSYFIATFKICR